MLNRMRAAFDCGHGVITALVWAIAALAPLQACGRALERGDSIERLTIIAPSAPGGGYDLTAQSMKRVLEGAGIVRSVDVRRSPGAGGLLGLAELIAAHAGDGRVLLIGGMVLMGATESNRAAISLLDVTPISRLTGEYEVIAVPANSPYQSLDDLLEAMRAAPGLIRWVGGSIGGADERLMWRLARATRVDPHAMHYTALPGGSEIAAQLMSGRFVAGISGIIELEDLVRSGRLRALAISSPEPLPGVTIPTFDELGVAGLSLMNWRGIFAAPAISDADRRALETMIERMVQHPDWRTELRAHHWEDAHLRSPDFTKFIVAQRDSAEFPPFAGEPVDPRILPSALARRLIWALAPALAALALVLALTVQRRRARGREQALRGALREVSSEAEQRAREVRGILAGVSAQIEREFDRWGLSRAERDVAHLMLKGPRLKDIAQMRNTTARTVRQQAHAIYRKAGLEGRSDLAAYFLEEFLAPIEVRGVEHAGAPVLLPLDAAPALKPAT